MLGTQPGAVEMKEMKWRNHHSCQNGVLLKVYTVLVGKAGEK